MKMNDNTILRIKVPAHLYEAVKAQLTLKESKKRISEAITGTEEELKAFYLRAKQIEAEGTDIDSAIEHALFDINNPDAAKELSLNEAKKNFGTKDMKPVKAAKAAGAASDKPKAHKKANAPVKVTPDNAVKADKETSKIGAGVSEAKKLGLEELKAIVELLNGQIAQLEEKKEEKAPVEESVDATIKEYEVIYIVRNGKCYRKDDEGNMDEVSMSKCRNMEEAREYDEFERDEEYDTRRGSWVPVKSNRYKKFWKPKSHTGTATMTAQQADDVTKSSFSKFDPTMDPDDPRGGFR